MWLISSKPLMYNGVSYQWKINKVPFQTGNWQKVAFLLIQSLRLSSDLIEMPGLWEAPMSLQPNDMYLSYFIVYC